MRKIIMGVIAALLIFIPCLIYFIEVEAGFLHVSISKGVSDQIILSVIIRK